MDAGKFGGVVGEAVSYGLGNFRVFENTDWWCNASPEFHWMKKVMLFAASQINEFSLWIPAAARLGISLRLFPRLLFLCGCNIRYKYIVWFPGPYF